MSQNKISSSTTETKVEELDFEFDQKNPYFSGNSKNSPEEEVVRRSKLLSEKELAKRNKLLREKKLEGSGLEESGLEGSGFREVDLDGYGYVDEKKDDKNKETRSNALKYAIVGLSVVGFGVGAALTGGVLLAGLGAVAIGGVVAGATAGAVAGAGFGFGFAGAVGRGENESAKGFKGFFEGLKEFGGKIKSFFSFNKDNQSQNRNAENSISGKDDTLIDLNKGKEPNENLKKNTDGIKLVDMDEEEVVDMDKEMEEFNKINNNLNSGVVDIGENKVANMDEDMEEKEDNNNNLNRKVVNISENMEVVDMDKNMGEWLIDGLGSKTDGSNINLFGMKNGISGRSAVSENILLNQNNPVDQDKRITDKRITDNNIKKGNQKNDIVRN